MSPPQRRSFILFFFFSSRRRHTRFKCDWSSDVCSSDLGAIVHRPGPLAKSDLNNFAPGVGLAWNFHPRFVFRSSFGVVHQDIFATGTNIMYQEYLATATLAAPTGDPRHVFNLAQGPDSFQYVRQPDGSVPF